MLTEITSHFDYFIVVFLAIILYRLLGEPLSRKV